jgi:thymidylate synthase (FAD)
MQILQQSHKIISQTDKEYVYKLLEDSGRIAYRSEDKITVGSAEKFIANIISRGHESVLEHYSLSIDFITDRGVSHELVRHRLCAFTQESTRYCNYSGKGVSFIDTVFWDKTSYQYNAWLIAIQASEAYYNILIKYGASPQEARTVLNNSVATKIRVTTNIREWRHILKLRTSKAAHPQMRALMIPLLRELQEKLPILFNDIEVEE